MIAKGRNVVLKLIGLDNKVVYGIHDDEPAIAFGRISKLIRFC